MRRLLRVTEATLEQRMHLELALSSWIEIEQAKGVLSERLRIGIGEAFELLRQTARAERRAVRDLAHEVLEAPETPSGILLRLQALLDRGGAISVRPIRQERTTMSSTAERVAKNDAVFRDANEQIEQAGTIAGLESIPFLCECADEGCTTLIRLTPAEYEKIRADARWFVVVPGHETNAEGYAEVVRREDGYVVVEKTGEAARIVEELDPRQEEDRR